MDANHEIQELRELVGWGESDTSRGFAEPWHARAFALTLALSERRLFSLRDFQAALIGKINSKEKLACIVGSDDYYTLWLAALESLLAQKKVSLGERLSLFEHQVVDDAESRKIHQLTTSRDKDGQLKIAPLVIDGGLDASSIY
ncbi:nitrile hydratase accessory protein [Rhodopseudomonas telluris]|uniref:Nitrile hydratase accessory protein n=1 Tax=Rhodopseudomonas telluris TaxID=644215 RepID=A0ABV6F0A5_9BRAD